VTAARAAAPVVAFAVVALLFWVLRNTPQGAWLAP
jgi:hypothetical protein